MNPVTSLRNSPSRFDQRAISDPRHPGSPSGMVSWNLNDHPAFRYPCSSVENMTRKMPRVNNLRQVNNPRF